MSKPVEFDEMLDVAFAEIYWTANRMDTEGKISPENTTEELARECKQIAADFVEAYEAACKLGELPSFYDDLWAYAEKELVKKYPPVKKYTVTIDAKLVYKFDVEATSKADARAAAMNVLINDPFIEKRIREQGEITETAIGGVSE